MLNIKLSNFEDNKENELMKYIKEPAFPLSSSLMNGTA